MTLLDRIKTEPLPLVPLFHYTDTKGLLGILNSNCLWATSALYLNDSSEYKYGLNLIKQAVRERSRSTNDDEERSALEFVWDGLSEVFPTVCIASLTQKGDLLSQWRAYARNGGFALGLHADNLRNLAHTLGFYLVRCIYDPEEQQDAVQRLVDEFCEVIASPDGDDWAALRGCVTAATRLAVMFKHRSFEEEHEWRLMSLRPIAELDFRPGVSTIVPFTKFCLPSDRNSYLQSIIVGPTPHPELARHSIETLLRKLGVSDPEKRVTETSIPYRDW
jgi:hypothetical protein